MLNAWEDMTCKNSLKLGRGWVTKLAVGEIREAQSSQNNLYHVAEPGRHAPTHVAFSYLPNLFSKLRQKFRNRWKFDMTFIFLSQFLSYISEGGLLQSLKYQGRSFLCY